MSANFTPEDFASYGSHNRGLYIFDRLHHFLAICRNDHILRINPAGASLLGLGNARQAEGMPFFSFVHPDYTALAEVGLEAVAEDGTVVSMKLARIDGLYVDVDLWASYITFQDEPAFLVEAHDITGHLRAAHALRSREQRLQGIIDSVADGVITLDRNGVIETFNPAAESIFGFSAHEMIGRDIHQLLIVTDASADPLGQADRLREMAASDNVVGQRKDGKIIQLEVAVRELLQDEQISFTAIVRDVTARKEAEMRIFHMAHHDALTGLPNRHLFGDRVDEGLKRAQRNATKLALVFIDLDRFKPINDTYGHASGDEVLKEMGRRLASGVRASDTVARVGGDEFMILLEGLSDREEAREVALKVRASLIKPITLGQHEIVIGASTGIAVYPDDANDALGLINLADMAMYRQKNATR